MNLAGLQRAFQQFVLEGNDAIAARVEPGPLANHRRRLAVYYDGYRSRLVEALATDFEALSSTIGREAFEDACRAYIEATPSVFRNVRWYGGGLPRFLYETAPWSEHAWLGDIALFEWTLTLAFDAADAAHVRFEELAALSVERWESLGFRLHPSARTIELRANAPAIRKAFDEGAPLPAPVFSQEATVWLIWRKARSVHFRSLAQPEAWAIREATRGRVFPEICEGLCEWFGPDQAAGEAAAWLRSWVDDELIAALSSTRPS
jgi:hypothetical protein